MMRPQARASSIDSAIQCGVVAVAQTGITKSRSCHGCTARIGRFKGTVRNIHADFQPFLPQKAHGYCVEYLENPSTCTLQYHATHRLAIAFLHFAPGLPQLVAMRLHMQRALPTVASSKHKQHVKGIAS
jgi:hypothetical protein